MNSLNNLISQLNIGYITNKEIIYVKNTYYNNQILKLLYNNGLINNYIKENKIIKIFIRYNNKGKILNKIKRISKESKKVFLKKKELKNKYNIGGILLISTVKGLKIYKNGLILKKKQDELIQEGGVFILKIK